MFRYSRLVLLTSLLLFMRLYAVCQDSTSITISGYLDVYYNTTTTADANGGLLPYTTVGAYAEQVSLNVAQLGVSVKRSGVRGRLTLHYGDIATATWSEDYPVIQEAQIGFHLGKEVWFDAGFFHTHVGAESFLPRFDRLSSTAYTTYNQPFYQAGLRLSTDAELPFYSEVWLINGYNQFRDINAFKSLGLLFRYRYNDYWTTTYSGVYGREDIAVVGGPDRNRYYHNLYVDYEREQWHLRLSGDYARQTNSKIGAVNKTGTLASVILYLGYDLSDKWQLTIRGERYNDHDAILTPANSVPFRRGLELRAATLGLGYLPSLTSYVRLEARRSNSGNFPWLGDRFRTEVLLTAGHWFDADLSLKR